jgi:hypothetical protein
MRAGVSSRSVITLLSAKIEKTIEETKRLAGSTLTKQIVQG